MIRLFRTLVSNSNRSWFTTVLLSTVLILGFSITGNAAGETPDKEVTGDVNTSWATNVEEALSEPVLVLPAVTPKTSQPIWPGADPDVGPVNGVPREGTSTIDPATLDETEEDPAVQLDSGSADSEAERIGGLVTLSEPIVDFLGQGGSNPNDTVGDVGTDHFVQAINVTFQVFDKSGTSLDGPFRLSSLWLSPDGVRDEACEFDRGDPVVLYDNLADRWLLSQFQPKAGEPGGAFSNFVCIAISQTPDPTRVAGYNLYAFDLGEFPDYFKIGAWTDGYYLSANGGQVPVWVFDRVSMLNGNPAAAIKLADVPNLPQSSFGLLLPADIDGLEAPPPGTPSYLYRQVDGDANGGGGDRIELYTANVNWADPGSSSLVGPTNIPLLPFNSALCGFLSFGCAPQPGTTSVLDPINEVGMFRFPYRNYGSREVMAGNFAVDVDGNDGHGIRWFVLERTGGGPWGVADQGTYAPQPPDAAAFVHRFMGSIAMDRHGNLALGYTATSAQDIFPSARYTGRTAGDPPGLLPATEQTIREGQASVTAGNNLARWGDYYALIVDPVDDCTFWYTGDFVPNPPTRQSVISSFRFSDCANDVRVTKWANPDPAMAGEQITYTINVYNAGVLDATNVQVTDTLPAGFSYVADSLPGAECADTTEPTIVCNIGDLPAYNSTNFTITAAIAQDILQGPDAPTTFDNLVDVVAEQADSDELNNSFTLSTLVNESADLEVEKICKPDEPVVAGALPPDPAGGKCEIFITNHGPSMARNATLVDEIFASAPYVVNWFADPGVSCTQPGKDIECNLGDIDAGQVIKVTVQVWSEGANDINDLATATSDTPDPDTSNNSDEGQINFIVPKADLVVTKQCQPVTPAPAGSTAICDIYVYNNGPQTAENVVLDDFITSDGNYEVVFVNTNYGVCTLPGVNVDIQCSLGNILSGDTAYIQVHFTSNDEVDVDDIATATSDTDDPDPNNNTATDSVSFQGIADLQIRKFDAPFDPVDAGTSFTYRLRVDNHGPSAAPNVVITDYVPAGTVMEAVVATGNGGCVIGVAGDPARPTECGVGTIPVDGHAIVRITVFVLPGTTGVLHNDATVYSDYYDNNNANDRVTEDTTIIVNTNLVVVKYADHDEVVAGTQLRYAIQLTNYGPSTATGVTLTDVLPPYTTWLHTKVLGGVGDCVLSGTNPDIVTCTLNDMDPGETFTIVITVMVDPSTPHGTTLPNCAEANQDVYPNTPPYETVRGCVDPDTVVITEADLWIDKTGSYITQNPGKNIIYTLTVHNDAGCSVNDPQVCGDGGPSDAQNVVVVDKLPSTPKKLVVTYTSEDCEYDDVNHEVTCVTPVLAAGDTVVHHIEATPKGALRAITNYASVTSSTLDPTESQCVNPPDTEWPCGNNVDEMTLIVGGGGQKGTGE